MDTSPLHANLNSISLSQLHSKQTTLVTSAADVAPRMSWQTDSVNLSYCLGMF